MIELAQQPLFRLLAAIIVLLIADMNPVYGLGALAIWTIWVYVSGSKFFVSKQ